MPSRQSPCTPINALTIKCAAPPLLCRDLNRADPTRNSPTAAAKPAPYTKFQRRFTRNTRSAAHMNKRKQLTIHKGDTCRSHNGRHMLTSYKPAPNDTSLVVCTEGKALQKNSITLQPHKMQPMHHCASALGAWKSYQPKPSAVAQSCSCGSALSAWPPFNGSLTNGIDRAPAAAQFKTMRPGHWGVGRQNISLRARGHVGAMAGAILARASSHFCSGCRLIWAPKLGPLWCKGWRHFGVGGRAILVPWVRPFWCRASSDFGAGRRAILVHAVESFWCQCWHHFWARAVHILVPVLVPVRIRWSSHFGARVGAIIVSMLGPFWCQCWIHFGVKTEHILVPGLDTFWCQGWIHFGPDLGSFWCQV